MKTIVAFMLLSQIAVAQIIGPNRPALIVSAYDRTQPVVVLPVFTRPPVVVSSSESIELTVYSMPGGQCPACVVLKRELSSVSWVRIVERPAPSWVRSYPTIVWSTEAGSRVKLSAGPAVTFGN